MNAFAAVNTYRKVGIESAVGGSDPHELISMLFQGALLAIAEARYQMEHREIAAKGRSISKALAIIDEGLFASLNMEAGGKIAEDLGALYVYMMRQLMTANKDNDLTILDEVARLLGELAAAWNAIRPQAVSPGQASNVSLGATRVQPVN